MTPPWTEAELKEEWQFVYDSRLAILRCYNKPDPEQDKMAREEADKAVAKLRKEHEPDQSPSPSTPDPEA